MIKPYLIKKDDQRLPDNYGMEVFFHGEDAPKNYEIAEHKIIDKVYEGIIIEGQPAFRCVGTLSTPYLEYKTKDDKLGIIPLNSIKDLIFDERFSKICAIKKERDEAVKSLDLNSDKPENVEAH